MTQKILAIIRTAFRAAHTDEHETTFYSWKPKYELKWFSSKDEFDKFDYGALCDDVTIVTLEWMGYVEVPESDLQLTDIEREKLRKWWAGQYGNDYIDNEIFALLDKVIKQPLNPRTRIPHTSGVNHVQ